MVDARGLSCPMPVVMTRKAVENGNPAMIEVLADSRTAVDNITYYANHVGYKVEVSDFEGDYKLTLTK